MNLNGILLLLNNYIHTCYYIFTNSIVYKHFNRKALTLRRLIILWNAVVCVENTFVRVPISVRYVGSDTL